MSSRRYFVSIIVFKICGEIRIIKYFKLMLLSFYVSSDYDIKSLGQKHNMENS